MEARFGIEQMVREAKETRRHRSACMKRKVDEGKEVVGGHRAAAIGKPLIISPKGVTSQNPDRLQVLAQGPRELPLCARAIAS